MGVVNYKVLGLGGNFALYPLEINGPGLRLHSFEELLFGDGSPLLEWHSSGHTSGHLDLGQVAVVKRLDQNYLIARVERAHENCTQGVHSSSSDQNFSQWVEFPINEGGVKLRNAVS